MEIAVGHDHLPQPDVLRLSGDFLLPKDSPLYEDGLQDSNEIMQMLSGLESSEAQSVRALARIKSKRTLSTFWRCFWGGGG